MASSDDCRPLLLNEDDDSPLDISDNRSQTQKISVPLIDRYNVVYFIFLFLGIGTILPFGVITNAKSFYLYKFRNLSLSNETHYLLPQYQTEMQIMFMSYLAIASTVPLVLFSFVSAFITKFISTRVRLLVSMVAVVMIYVTLLVFVEVKTDSFQTEFYILTLVSVAVLSSFTAIEQGSVFGLASQFPMKYMQATMSGMGMAGLFAATANVLILAVGMGPVHSGMTFFSLGLTFLIFTLAGYLLLPYLPYAEHVLGTIKQKQLSVNVNPRDENNENHASMMSESELDDLIVVPRSKYLQALRCVWKYAICIFLLTCTTFSCYPVLNSAIYSMLPHSQWTDIFFTPVTCFLLFPLCDVTGRLAAGIFQLPSERSFLLPVLCVIRIGFIPLFMLCNVQPRNNLPVAFNEDWMPIVLLVIFGFTNGHLSTLTMIYSARRSLMEHAEQSGMLMSISISCALATGSVISLFLIKAV